MLFTVCTLSRYVDDEQLIIIYFEIDANEGNEEAAAFDRKAILAYMNHLASFDGGYKFSFTIFSCQSSRCWTGILFLSCDFRKWSIKGI